MAMNAVRASRSAFHSLSVLILAVAGIGLAFRLEGAPPRGAPTSTPQPPTPNATAPTNATMWANAARDSADGLPIFPPQIVDWADDEPTRLRRAGLLQGGLPLPSPSRAAGPAGCTYDIECEDGLPCTTDRCVIDLGGGPGSGFCSNDVTPAGLPGDCDDGVFCNGIEYCDGVNGATCVQGPPAMCCGDPQEGSAEYCTEVVAWCDDVSLVPYKRCTSNADCGGGKCHHCVSHCASDAACNDGFVCNGTETCQNPGPDGVCLPGPPLCGANGAICSEARCRNVTTHQNQAPPTACTIDDDCNTLQGFSCETVHEQDQSSLALCFLGRCCSSAAEPVCTVLRLNQSPPTPCNVAGGSKWYPGDDLRTTADCGDENPAFPGEDLGCPKYSSGIEQTSATVVPAHPVAAGPMSQSPVPVQPPNGPGVAFSRIGDDYSFSNSSHVELRAVRLVGFMSVPEAIFIEFWDAGGNFIEDFLFHPSQSPGVNVLYLSQPLIIPPQGRISAITKREFGMGAKFIWLSASPAATTGGNDADKLYVNDELAAPSPPAVNYMSPDPGVLSFELVGPKVAAPLGGCCQSDGTCSNELSWVCDGLGATFHGVGVLCNYCAHAANGGVNCGRCATGGAVCNSDAECGANGPCSPDDAVCLGSRCSNNDKANCTVPSVCPARPGYCSNADVLCAIDGDCPGGTCGGEGTCLSADCAALDACGVGACCNSAGTCEVKAPGDCMSPDAFLGLGTTCDPNACPQPCDPVADPGGDPGLWDCDCTDGKCYTGADDCADAIVHPIPALLPADPPYVVTIYGDRTYATSSAADPDSCWGPATAVNSDLGWWEAFELTGNCTRIRFDYCGTYPVQFGDWAFLAKDCACEHIEQGEPDPYLAVQSIEGRGPPFCNDDNLWVIMGMLRAGTYYVPVNSTLEDVLGPYQLHVVAEACPVAACCLPNGSCLETNQFDCDDQDGVFLAPPQRFPPVATCAMDTCQYGSCCGDAGMCEDTINGEPRTNADCPGNFIPGLKCEGCTCEADPAFSCNDHNDCIFGFGGPGGLCDLANCAARSVAQPNPCALCAIEGWPNCNRWDNPSGFSSSISELSLGSGLVAADDFIPTSGTTAISELCVWGSYFFTDPDVEGLDCQAQVTADHFRVRVMRSTPEGLPDSSPAGIVGVTITSSVKAIVPQAGSLQVGDGYETFIYRLTLDTPITGLIDDGATVYWLEVANNLAPTDGCFWLWHWISDESEQGNDFSASGSGAAGYPIGSQRTEDQAFCLGHNDAPVNFVAPPEPLRPCCTCQGVCLFDTLGACKAALAEYRLEAVDQDCGTFLCPLEGQPAHDACADAADVYVGTSPISVLCTTTDGINPVLGENGNISIVNDMWLKFKAPQNCTLRLDMCATADAYDSALAVYSNGTTNCECPTTQSIADATFLEAGDETCSAGAAVSGAAFVEVPATEDQCFMIRVGQYCCPEAMLKNTGVIDISCGPPICGNNVAEASNNEECDGVDAGICPPGGCMPNCLCGGPPTCGDGIAAGNEECDWAPPVDDANCPGLCQQDCTCASACGNESREGSEECDGQNDTSCGGVPGRCCTGLDAPLDGCTSPCTCPPVVCGNGFKDPNEECDPGVGTNDDGDEDDAACDGFCRAVNDPAGECTCACVIDEPPGPEPELGSHKNRFVGVVIPQFAANRGPGAQIGLRVRLTTLNHPRLCCSGQDGNGFGTGCNVDSPCDTDADCFGATPLCRLQLSLGTPDFASMEGNFRYVNSFPGGSLVCADDGPPFNTTYRCATLGCQPEYRDWFSDLSVPVSPSVPSGLLYITGDAVVPSSMIELDMIASSCGTAPGANTCSLASFPAQLSTARWGDITSAAFGPPDGRADVLDIPAVTNKLKGVAPFFPEHRTWLKHRDPAADLDAITVLDLSDIQDAVLAKPYPADRTIDACSHD